MLAIVLLSGEIATGKTAVADCLIQSHGFRRASTGAYLKELAGRRNEPVDRDTLKNIGDNLDAKTNGQWVANLVQRQIEENPSQRLWLLDSIRRGFQIPWLREQLKQGVVHVHLTAPASILRERYERRRSQGSEYATTTSYEEAKSGPTEQQVRTLSNQCDLLIDTAVLVPEAAAKTIVDKIKEINLN